MKYYIFPMKSDRYASFRKERIYRKRQSNYDKFVKINTQDQVLVYLLDTERIVAEYEVTHVKITDGQVTLQVEPIYNAPPGGGVRMDILTLVGLKSYESLDIWKDKLDNSVLEVQEGDFVELSRKLTL